MKELLGTVLGLALVAAFGATAIAAPLTTDNSWPVYVPPDYEYTFSGFGSGQITSASLEIYVFTYDVAPEAAIYFDDVFVGNSTVAGDYANPIALSYDYDALASYLADDSLTLKLGAASGSFFLRKAELNVNSVANPIPSTVWLFGLGLVSLVTMRRRSRQS